MNLTHLRAFHLVASHGSYSRAANLAGLTQPTLSEQVRALEAKYGTKLVQRTGRGIELSSTGMRLFEVTKKMFAAQSEAEAILTGVHNLTGTRLRFDADAPVHAVPIMRRLRDAHPGISISLRIKNSAEIRGAVLAGTADIGITAQDSPHPRLTTRFLSQQDLVALVRTDSALGSRKSMAIAELAKESLIMREPGSITRQAMAHAMATAMVRAGTLIETDSREAVHGAVLAGLGVGAIGEDEFNEDPRMTILDFTDQIPPLKEYIAYRTDRANDPLVVAVLHAARL